VVNKEERIRAGLCVLSNFLSMIELCDDIKQLTFTYSRRSKKENGKKIGAFAEMAD